MLAALFFGCGYAFAAGVQPGPLQAFLFSRVAAIGWRKTLPATLAPVISDGPIVVAALFLVGQLSMRTQSILQMAGGLVLFYFAWGTLRQLWREKSVEGPPSTPRTMVEAVVVNLLNPHPYLGWTLILGPAVLVAWERHPSHAVALVVAFYVTLVATLAGFVLLFGTAGRLGDAAQRKVLGVSGSILAVLGLYLLVGGIIALSTE